MVQGGSAAEGSKPETKSRINMQDVVTLSHRKARKESHEMVKKLLPSTRTVELVIDRMAEKVMKALVERQMVFTYVGQMV